MLRKLLAVILALWTSVALAAAPPIPPSAPTILPSGLQDIGAPTALPFVIACMGQSNAVGQDNLGSKVVQPNIFTTNDESSPTSIVPAAFGTDPFNGTIGGGTTTNPTLAYNNQCVWFANYLRLSGLLPAARPIVIMPNFYSSQSINQWIGNGSATIGGTVLTLGNVVNLTVTSSALTGSPITVSYTLGAGETTTTIATGLAAAINANTVLQAAGISASSATNVVNPTYPTNLSVTWGQSVTGGGNETVTLSFVTPPHWTQLLANLAVLDTAYPNAKINHVIWDQGENDSSGTAYSTQASYLVGFAALEAQFRSLPSWIATATISATEMGTWSSNASGDLRNDALRVLADGYFDPWTTVVTSACPLNFITTTCESAENAGPHFNGWALMLLGQRHFQAWERARINGGFHEGLNTYYGAGLSFPNQLSISSAGVTLNPDDIRTGVNIATAGGAISLPKASLSSGPVLFTQGNNTVTINVTGALSNLLAPNNRNNVGSYQAPVFSSVMAVPIVSQNTWRLYSVGQNKQGDQGRYAGLATLTGVLSLDVSQMNGVALHFNGATVTLTNNFGLDLIANDDTGSSIFTVSVGTFSMPDGSTPTSLTLQPGETVWMFSRITATSTLITQVVYLVQPPGTVYGGPAPTPTGSCAVNTQLGGNTAGSYKANGVCAAGTVILTFNQTAPNGWTCKAQDLTTPADIINQTAYSQTSVTFTGTMASADLVTFGPCGGF